MITSEQLADGFALNLRIIQMQTDGLTHTDSLIQAPYHINCLNWVLGHIAVNRDQVLKLLGEDPLLSDTETALYRRGSDPLTGDDEDILSLERLLDVLKRSQECITDGMTRLAPEEFAREITEGQKTTTLGSRLYGLYFHDTYHTGQTDLLRQVAGKNDQVIR